MADHPTDRTLGALVDANLDDDSVAKVRAHVDSCPRCRFRIEESQPAVELPKLSGLPATHIELPQEDRERTPTRGDIWRLNWDDDDALAVIWNIESDQVRVLPIVNAFEADEWSILLDDGDTMLGDGLAVNVAFATTVSWAVLDAAIGTLTNITTVDKLLQAFERGTPTDLPTGDPILHPSDERLVDLEETSDLFARLANIAWPPTIEPTETAFDFDTLLGILGETRVARALAISNRGAAPTDEEAELIQAATGQRPSGTPIAPETIAVLNLPKWKPTVRRRAARHQSSEADARRELARQADQALIAARGIYGGKVNPELLLERFLDDAEP